MSWLFSQALAAEYSADTCLAGEPSAQSSETPTQQAYCSPDKMTAYSRLSRFGMTFKPLTDDRGADVLTWFLEGFPARTYPSPERAQELTGHAPACGLKWHASLAKFDPATSTWRTVQPSLLGDSDECSVTWPRSGMTADGRCWALPTVGRRTSETDSGWWLTPTVCGNYNRKGASATSGDGLATAVKMFRTPMAADAWKWSNYSAEERLAQGRQVLLSHQLQVGGQLSPMWVEWLMGWPLGWTDLKPLEMARFREWQQQHSVNSLKEAA